MKDKNEPAKNKSRLHIRNKHRERYNFKLLIESCPELGEHIKPNKHAEDSIDFSSQAAVKQLNKALLMRHYNLEYWDVPDGYVSPPIPGRADHMHYAADLIGGMNFGTIPRNSSIKCLDIGVGANCIYPIIGVEDYNWDFVGADIDEVALSAANSIIEKNAKLKGQVELRHQEDANNTLKGVIQFDEQFDLVVCNPPIYDSLTETPKGSSSKPDNLNEEESNETNSNLGKQSDELVTEGGERQFIKNYIRQSKRYGNSCFWFSTLVSKKSSAKLFQAQLQEAQAASIMVRPLGPGKNSNRLLGWTFLKPTQQKEWRASRWGK